MPAKPLTEDQLADASRLRAAFRARQDVDPSLTQEALAHLCNWKTQGAVNQYLNGKIPLNLQALLKFSKALGVEPEEISPALAGQFRDAAALVLAQARPSNGSGLAEAYQIPETTPRKRSIRIVNPGDSLPDDSVQIRKVKLHLQAGTHGIRFDVIEEDDSPITFKKAWLEKYGYQKDKLIAISVKGHSMEPALYDGDTVVINTVDKKPTDGDVFAVNYEGEDVIKRMVRDNGTWWLQSDNPDQRRYPRKICEGDACIMIGRIVYRQGNRI